MITPKRIGKIAVVALLCTAASVSAAASSQECDERVSLAGLIAHPDAYHGKALWVVAHATIDFENMTACPSENETEAKSCLWLNVDDGPYKTDEDYARYQSKRHTWEQFNLQTVAIHARFDKTSKGHFSMWPGELRNVQEVSGHQGGWSFTANTAVPRTACAGELPVPVESIGRFIRIGNLKFRNGDYDGAIADFTRALELDPGVSRVYLMRGDAKRLKRDYVGAVADVSRAIELEREYKDVMYSARAGVKELMGDLDGAIADYTRAIEIDPKFDGTYHSRGLVKEKKGDSKGAAADFARAKQLAPAQ